MAEASAELTTIWVDADPAARRALAAATNSLDQDRRAAPDLFGGSRGDAERVVFAHPLAVWIEIDHGRGLVWVLHVWQIRRRGG